ncbi:helix-turn-helix domain-containing protein [Niabella sp. CC-SYL272]|uniref:helix-turn-helix transcriptional regulator n=1 Tax=Niabella agricola TaxID=2891571 RepID=UPI001F2F4F9A|nr:helix-turn-helix domain-containing protein [Niabella agricola]MCF3111246.1 helix-turn-helix domain-containing protein [Niabella agricola]
MSTNIRVKKICQQCKQPFIAQKTVTKFCSLKCASRNYKKRQKEQKVTKTILATNQQAMEQSQAAASAVQQTPAKGRLHMEWLSVHDVSQLLGIAERTLFRQIKDPAFPKLKIGRRLLFSKQQVLDYFISKSEGL